MAKYVGKTTVVLTEDDLYWILQAFANSTPSEEDMEPGERLAYRKLGRAEVRARKGKFK